MRKAVRRPRCRVTVASLGSATLLLAGSFASTSATPKPVGAGFAATWAPARLRAARSAPGRQGRDAAEQRQAGGQRLLVGRSRSCVHGRDGHRLPVGRVPAGRSDPSDLGEFLRVAATWIRAAEPHRLRRPALRGAVVLRPGGGGLLQPGQEDPGHPRATSTRASTSTSPRTSTDTTSPRTGGTIPGIRTAMARNAGRPTQASARARRRELRSRVMKARITRSTPARPSPRRTERSRSLGASIPGRTSRWSSTRASLPTPVPRLLPSRTCSSPGRPLRR